MIGAPRMHDLEFSLVDFTLEFQEAIDLDLARQLRLRRDLRGAARQLFGEGGARGGEADPFAELFDPPLSHDPVALRRFQRPGPPFVLLADPARCGTLTEGDTWTLSLLFWGKGVQMAGDFARVLAVMGERGFQHGEGRFEIIAVAGVTASGERTDLWRPGRNLAQLAPPVLPVHWWLEALAPRTGPLTLRFLTPARLLSQGRPLFRPDFKTIFPFILRRVSSMAHAHCGVEVIENPAELQQIAARVEVVACDLFWEDWRTLEGERSAQDIGGVSGQIVLDGAELDDLEWLLRLGSLLNLGKSASFGSGRYRLS